MHSEELTYAIHAGNEDSLYVVVSFDLSESIRKTYGILCPQWSPRKTAHEVCLGKRRRGKLHWEACSLASDTCEQSHFPYKPVKIYPIRVEI